MPSNRIALRHNYSAWHVGGDKSMAAITLIFLMAIVLLPVSVPFNDLQIFPTKDDDGCRGFCVSLITPPPYLHISG